MELVTDKTLLESIEAFLAEQGMAPSRFGREVMGDGALVQHLRAGRSLSLRNAEKVLRFMREYQASEAA